VVDCVGGKVLGGTWRTIKSGGFLVSLAQPADTAKSADGVQEGVRSLWVIVEPDVAQLEAIGDLFQKGLAHEQVDNVWELKEYEAAWKKVSGGPVRGKVVLRGN
jgi:NADPH:quinone reductase-like Zn-dependent oxidoreductase